MRRQNVVKRCASLIVGACFVATLAVHWRSSLSRTHSVRNLDVHDGVKDLQECIEKVSACSASKLPSIGPAALCNLLPSFPNTTAANEAEAAIPRVIHQSWRDNVTLPLDFREWAQSWRDNNPGWRYSLWTDSDNHFLVKQHYPWLLASYNALPAPIMRADTARYVYMHVDGGVYADLDTWCLQPLGSLFDKYRSKLHDSVAVMAKISANDAFEHNVPVGISIVYDAVVDVMPYRRPSYVHAECVACVHPSTSVLAVSIAHYRLYGSST